MTQPKKGFVNFLQEFSIPLIAGVVGMSVGLVQAVEQRKRAEKAEGETARELARATEVKTVLKGMLRGVSPEEALGADTTLIKRLVEDTVRRLDAGEIEDEVIAGSLLTHDGAAVHAAAKAALGEETPA